MKIDIENRIKTVMSSVLNISKSEIHNKTSSDTIKSGDSLKHMNLSGGVEEGGGIDDGITNTNTNTKHDTHTHTHTQNA